MMSGTSAPRKLSCPRCGETILAEDKFCFHCGVRLGAIAKASVQGSPPKKRFPQWPLAIIGAMALVLAAYVVHQRSRVIAGLKPPSSSAHVSHSGHGTLTLHPVVSTTTTYPSNSSSSRNWTEVVEKYQKVHFALRLPNDMNTSLSASKTEWVWGKSGTPYRIILGVVSGKPPSASTNLGPKTYGTNIVKHSSTATQSLYINWSAGKWVEVFMTVPANKVSWLEAIAQSVRVS